MKVIIAIDQTDYWKQVIEAVLQRHWPKDTLFKILTVIAPLEHNQLDCVDANAKIEQLVNHRLKTAQQILQQARQLLAGGVAHCSVHAELRQGSPRIEIIDTATDWMADKIMIGAHGHAGNRLFPGVVSRAVAQSAHCSVELIRLREPGQSDSEKTIKQATPVPSAIK